MIKKIAGKNFQGYEEFQIEFHPGVNVIIGKSDAGKTAAFNLLDWIRTNGPLGEDFRSEWGGTTEGEIWTTDGQRIKRVKSDTINSYQINDEKPLKAFGQNPPDAVLEILALDEINIQTQNETPFLLGKPFWSPGEVAKTLNKAASLEDIDVSTSNLTKGYRKAAQGIESTKNKLEDHKQELEKYKDLPELEKLISELERLEQDRNTLLGQMNALKRLQENIIRIKGCLERTIDVRPAEKLLQRAEKINQKREKLIQDQERLQNLADSIDQAKTNKENTDKTVTRLQKEYDELVPDKCPLCGGQMKSGKQ